MNAKQFVAIIAENVANDLSLVSRWGWGFIAGLCICLSILGFTAGAVLTSNKDVSVQKIQERLDRIERRQATAPGSKLAVTNIPESPQKQ